jgi:hypothetical protein
MLPLLSANAIRTAVQNVLADPRQERVVVVAFVGKDPTRWLPSDMKGIKLYCWPKPGSTNPASIEALLNEEVDVHFVDNLHAKVFWGETGGAVIGSANLSENGMEDERLIEAAVQLESGNPAIVEFLDSIKSRAVRSDNPRFKEAFDRLHVADVQHWRNNPPQPKAVGSYKNESIPTFGDWCDSKMPERWQLGWWEETRDPPRDAANEFSSRYPGAEYETWLPCAEGELINNVATLCIKLNSNFWRVALRPQPFWWYPEDFVVSKQKNAQKFPYNWFARVAVPPGRSVPFDSREKRFQLALIATVRCMKDGITRLRGPVKGEFLSELKRNYAEA